MPRPDPIATKNELESKLRIDPDGLDECLVEQPGFFYHVAQEVAASNARRDTVKLELEEKSAQLDGQIRQDALAQERKVTEAGIQNELRSHDDIKALHRRFLDARAEAEQWAALREAFQQRSFMLRELVALTLMQAQNLGVERGAVSARHDIGDRNRAAAEALRRSQRTERYRPKGDNATSRGSE